jgi:hypothetical protein
VFAHDVAFPFKMRLFAQKSQCQLEFTNKSSVFEIAFVCASVSWNSLNYFQIKLCLFAKNSTHKHVFFYSKCVLCTKIIAAAGIRQNIFIPRLASISA